ncbi:MAG TPA: GNAT family N-acetyltransferase [Gammaproteobacteria bacterium]|nr:GNAT family N-acetyltransferase [Gammaproteobacteria bacterium]
MKIKGHIFVLLYVVLITIFICPIGHADIQKEHNNMMGFMIQNNLKDYLLYLSREGKYEVKSFGNVVASYTDLPSLDFNYIFDYSARNEPINDLQSALAYSKQQRYPFMLVRSDESNNAALKSVLEQFNYKHVGIATRMAIAHDSINFDDLDKTNIKQVLNQQMLDEFGSIMDDGFGAPTGTSKTWFSAMKDILSPDFQVKLYLIYDDINGELKPVGCAALYLPSDKKLLAGHYCWAVRVEQRKKGLMTKLAKNMVLIAKQQGYSSSVAQCFDASVRLAESIGFKKYGELELYAPGN